MQGKVGKCFLVAYYTVAAAWLLAILCSALRVPQHTRDAEHHAIPSGVSGLLLCAFESVLITFSGALVAGWQAGCRAMHGRVRVDVGYDARVTLVVLPLVLGAKDRTKHELAMQLASAGSAARRAVTRC